MRSVQYRRWCPPQSPLRVDFPADLLSQLQPTPGSPESSGILYGLRRGRDVRVVTSRPSPDEGLEIVGVFVSRSRGEVFLTEADLGFFESQGGAVALVIAGNHAGFFVREADESIQTVRSHEEFPVLHQPLGSPRPVVRASKWAWTIAGLMVLIALPAAAVAYLRPAFPPRTLPPLSLHLEEDHSQLYITWTSGQHALLQIVDGSERTAVSVPPDQSNATYARRTGDVQVSLIPLDGGPTRRESGHFVGLPLAAPPTEVSSEIEYARAEVDELLTQAVNNDARIEALQETIHRLASRRHK